MSILTILLLSIYFMHSNAQSYLNVNEDPYIKQNIESLREHYDTNREALIYKLCTHRSRFTEQELETARIYIQTRYINGASIKPQRAPCKSIKVIRDFKCLTHQERIEFIDAFKQVYAKGVIDRISYYHGVYWPFVHLEAQSSPFHSRFLLDLQQEIEKINPSVIAPYWDTALDFAAPHKSIIWDYFGHAGNQSNGYCVPDGPFKNQTLKYPTQHCLKREWNIDGSIPAWESPELLTTINQQSVDSLSPFDLLNTAEHFKKHLNIGGNNGDMSITYATNDPVFHLFHIYVLFLQIFKWQLQHDRNLVSLEFNSRGRFEPRYDLNEGKFLEANIETDTILSYNNVTIAEGFTFGFGDFCYIPDQIIEHVNNVVNMRKPKLPAAVERMRQALPAQVFAKYFPLFANNTYTELNYFLPDIGSSANNQTCKSLPIPPLYNSTEKGKRQFELFNFHGKDGRNSTLYGEVLISEFINTLNQYNYCSPYL